MINGLAATGLTCVRDTRCLFTDLSFSITSGEMLLITGANGSGKTSLLRLLAGISLPTAGAILYNNRDISQTPHYHQQLHYVGHTNGVKLSLSPLENLRLQACLAGLPQLTNTDYQDILHQLNLNALADQPLRQLSAGQRRRLTLGKLMLVSKPLWILDEPLTALDQVTQALFIALLKQHLDEAGLVVMSSHQPLPIQLQRACRSLAL